MHVKTLTLVDASQNLEVATSDTQATRKLVESTSFNLRETQEHFDRIDGGQARIAKSLQDIQDKATTLYAAEARLIFEQARLKKSCEKIHNSLDKLRESQNALSDRQAETQEITEFSHQTMDLIEQIEEAMRLNLPVDDLIEQGNSLKEDHANSLKKRPSH